MLAAELLKLQIAFNFYNICVRKKESFSWLFLEITIQVESLRNIHTSPEGFIVSWLVKFIRYPPFGAMKTQYSGILGWVFFY